MEFATINVYTRENGAICYDNKPTQAHAFIENSQKMCKESHDDIIVRVGPINRRLNRFLTSSRSNYIKKLTSKLVDSQIVLDLSVCDLRDVEDVIRLLHTGDASFPVDRAANIYEILVKLECNDLQMVFKEIFQDILRAKKSEVSKTDGSKNGERKATHSISVSNDDKTDMMTIKFLHKIQLTLDTILKQMNLNESGKKANPSSSLTDVTMNKSALDSKLVIGKKVFDLNDIEEINKIPDLFRQSKQNLADVVVSNVIGKKNFTQSELDGIKRPPELTAYRGAKIIIGDKIIANLTNSRNHQPRVNCKKPNRPTQKAPFSKKHSAEQQMADFRGSRYSVRGRSQSSCNSQRSRNLMGLMKIKNCYKKPERDKAPQILYKMKPSLDEPPLPDYKRLITPPGNDNYVIFIDEPSQRQMYSLGSETAFEQQRFVDGLQNVWSHPSCNIPNYNPPTCTRQFLDPGNHHSLYAGQYSDYARETAPFAKQIPCSVNQPVPCFEPPSYFNQPYQAPLPPQCPEYQRPFHYDPSVYYQKPIGRHHGNGSQIIYNQADSTISQQPPNNQSCLNNAISVPVADYFMSLTKSKSLKKGPQKGIK
uniref:BTB domain-containing protein n=1 Tax=Rhabditophanes sp. KR3021 TaxID=114890 RepID=A0AC35UHY2_9BILA